MSVILKHPWTRQPQYPAPLDGSYPLNAGAGLVAHPPRGIASINAVAGSAGWTNSGASIVARPDGLAVATNATYISTATSPIGTIAAGGTFTIAATFRIADTTTDGFPLSLGTSANDLLFLGIRVNDGGAGVVSANFRDDDSVIAIVSSGVTLAVGQYCKAVFVNYGSASRSLIVNGVRVNNTTSVAGAATFNQAAIGALLRTGASHWLNGSTNFAYTNKRAWSDAEIAAFMQPNAECRHFAPLPRRIWAPAAAAAGSTGTFAVTTVNDTASASGTTTVLGSFSKTLVNDTMSASGTTTILGTLAQTLADDTMTASGVVGGVEGTFAVTTADDTMSASGTTTIVGSLSTTIGNDFMTASGTTTILGSFAVTIADDTMNATGFPGAAPSVTTYLPLTGVGS